MAITVNPIISVIVPCYNHGVFLSEALSSVLDQTFQNWECIIVNNGSTDNSEAVGKKYVNMDSRFRYFFQENKGVSSARNLAIANSSGQYILPLDADDKIGNRYLEKSLAEMESRPILKVVYCKAKLFGDADHVWELPEFNMKNFLIENMVFCTGLYRKSDFEKTTGYDEQMKDGFEDWDFWLSLIDNEKQVCCIPEILFYYRIKKDSRNSTVADNMDTQLKLREYLFVKHKELYLKHCYIPELTQRIVNLERELKLIELTSKHQTGIIGKLKSLFRWK